MGAEECQACRSWRICTDHRLPAGLFLYAFADSAHIHRQDIWTFAPADRQGMTGRLLCAGL